MRTFLTHSIASVLLFTASSAFAGGSPPGAGGGWVKVEKQTADGHRPFSNGNLAWSESSAFGGGVEGPANRRLLLDMRSALGEVLVHDTHAGSTQELKIAAKELLHLASQNPNGYLNVSETRIHAQFLRMVPSSSVDSACIPMYWREITISVSPQDNPGLARLDGTPWTAGSYEFTVSTGKDWDLLIQNRYGRTREWCQEYAKKEGGFIYQ